MKCFWAVTTHQGRLALKVVVWHWFSLSSNLWACSCVASVLQDQPGFSNWRGYLINFQAVEQYIIVSVTRLQKKQGKKRAFHTRGIRDSGSLPSVQTKLLQLTLDLRQSYDAIWQGIVAMKIKLILWRVFFPHLLMFEFYQPYLNRTLKAYTGPPTPPYILITVYLPVDEKHQFWVVITWKCGVHISGAARLDFATFLGAPETMAALAKQEAKLIGPAMM